MLAFTVAVSLASTLVFGSITALKHALHVDASKTFGGARGSSASRERSATRNALVVVQVALALVLVVSAALMIRTFQALRDVEPGFADPATIQTARIWIPNAVSFRPDAIHAHAARDPRQDRGASGRGFRRLSRALPADGRGADRSNAPMAVEGQTLAPGETPPPRRIKFVSPGLLRSHGHANHCRPRHDVGATSKRAAASP